MPVCDLANKSDANILTDLQNITSNVTAFAWVGGNPQATFTTEPTDKEKAAIRRYFAENAHKEWVEI